MEPKTEWQINYGLYLRSPEWREKREAVLRRDGYLCQACGKNPATAVHHASYRYGRYTPLWDLKAVCRICHEQLTALDKGQIPTWDFTDADLELPY
jgi:5-methylcytosine-specific restriction endonuclease McrA